MQKIFEASKVALRDLALHRVADDLRRDNETPDWLRKGHAFSAFEPNTEGGSMWDQTTQRVHEFDDDYTLPTRTRMRRRAAKLLRKLRKSCAKDLRSHATSRYVPDELRLLAFEALAHCDIRTMCYLVLVCDDVKFWSLDHRQEWLDQSPLAQEQRRYNAKQETLRDPVEDDGVVINAPYFVIVQDPEMLTNPAGATLASLPTDSSKVKLVFDVLPAVQAGASYGDGRTLVAAGNSPTRGVDIRGFHRPSSYSRKQRWAYCELCSEIQCRRVWFQTYAKSGNGVCDCCGNTEVVIAQRQRELGTLTVSREITVSRCRTMCEEYTFMQTAKGGWLTRQIVRTLSDGSVSTIEPMTLCPVELSNRLQRAYKRQQQQVQR